MAKGEDFWKEELAPFQTSSCFPVISTISSGSNDHEIINTNFQLPHNDALDNTLASKLQLAWAFVISQYTMSLEVIFGFAASGRDVSLGETYSSTSQAMSIVPFGVQLKSKVTLEWLSRSLALLLRRKYHIRPGSYVPVYATKSKWTLVAVMAILRTGGAFVLLAYPQQSHRLAVLVQTVKATVVITTTADEVNFPELHISWLTLTNGTQDLINTCDDSLEMTASPNDPAYIMFTSGSTGKPKGIVIPHTAIATNAVIAGKKLLYNEESRIFHFASYAFDVSISEIFYTLVHGGCVLIPKESEMHDNLPQVVSTYGANKMAISPSLLRSLSPHNLPSMKSITVGGEAPQLPEIELWSEHVVINSYGPAEYAVQTTANFGIKPSDEPMNIGRSHIAACWIVSKDDTEKQVPIGAIGELLIEGPIVGMGYLDDPERTSKAFIEAPSWLKSLRGVERLKCYRTGDLVRYSSSGDGPLVFMGRKGNQVKLRGQRIELGEVEFQVRRLFESAKDVAVDVVNPGKSHYFLLTALIDTGASSGAVTVVPDTKPREADATGIPRIDFAGTCRGYLKIDVDDVGKNDHFFYLGGDSISAMRLCGGARLKGPSLAVADIFNHPQLDELAATIGESDTTERDGIRPFSLLDGDRDKLIKLGLPYVSSIDLEKAKSFWVKELADCVAPAFPRRSHHTTGNGSMGNLSYTFEFNHNRNLKNSTMSTIIKLTWGLTVSQYHGSQEVVFGNVSYGRAAPVPGIEHLTSPILVTAPVRITIDEEQAVQDALESVQVKMTKTIPYEQVGLHNIQQWTPGPASDAQNLLVIQTGDENNASTLEQGALYTLSSDTVENTRNGTYPLTIMCTPESTGAKLSTIFDTEKVKKLKSLNSRDAEELQSWNGAIPEPVHKCLHDLVTTQAVNFPTFEAVCSWDGSLTYSELGQLSSGLAAQLSKRDIGPGVVVAVYIPRSLLLPVVLVSVLKTGAAFLILDVEQSQERFHSLCVKAQASLAVCLSSDAPFTSRLWHHCIDPTPSAHRKPRTMRLREERRYRRNVVRESIKDRANGSVYSDQCNILISATGALNAWKWPDIPGLADFQGKLMHSARWDEGYDYTVSFPCIEHELQSVHNVTRIGTPEQVEARDVIAKSMQKRLARKPELFDKLLPSFPPFCRRITPGPRYLEALTDENVDVITTNIVKVKTDGIVTADSALHRTDVLVCATGFDTSFTLRFPVLGRGGLSLSERWEKTPETYLSVAVDDFPNYFICFGPNSALGEGNLLIVIEKSTDYIIACVEKMQRDNILTMRPRKEAVGLFTKYCDQHFSRTMFGQGCSSLHAMKVLGHPRWEDFAYEYVNDNPNGWLGDGRTLNEKNKAIDVAYLNDEQIDFPPAVVEVITFATIIRIATIAATEESRRRAREADAVMLANRQCTSMKLRCDGMSPCGSCTKRGYQCNNERKDHKASRGLGTSAAHRQNDNVRSTTQQPIPLDPVIPHEEKDHQPPSDRGSIRFLLNGGTDSFTERFMLPPRGDRARGLEYHTQRELEASQGSMISYPGLKAEPPVFLDSDPATLSFSRDNFLEFFNGPFGAPNKSMEDLYADEIPFQVVMPPMQDPRFASLGHEPLHEPERPFAMELIRAIHTKAYTVALDPKTQQEIAAGANYLLTTARIRKFVSMYFKFWQPSCSMLHQPSFDPEIVSLPLLIAVVFMGAMYSDDATELHFARRLVDFAELVVFSSDIYSCENEIGLAFGGRRNTEIDANDWSMFQNFQAGFIIVVAQYWGGTRVSRNRAMENRFSEVIKVARRIGLPKSRHQLEERTHEGLWIQKECRIRSMSYISLLDCAFVFYQNYPCRLSHTEMESDFPCAEAVFASGHPFQEPKFQLMREFNISDTFQSLFHEHSSKTSSPSGFSMSGVNMLSGLTFLDMFILIHMLYAFTNTHVTLLSTLLRRSRVPIPQAARDPATGKRRQSAIPEDSTLSAIRIALKKWHECWMALSSTISQEEWASMGFYRNAYNFWLVAGLLINHKESVDVVMQMEVKCEDKLQKLSVLLQDEND
ncbi:uncharacterized protein KD926_000058 [Aspergillus affinis]|uniref:uncharacterized protein n=1 Tax=Aspergillus affinis TaxID=1070780 RepID=UPI0022FE72FA|nr:uncharacterized protein KD926_000058 [Aspergillus affinis]KAI9037717.1 hypothetical protein KD926_000058 [Aspergillus affinis]